jgi:AcrR family transcriptional regulator
MRKLGERIGCSAKTIYNYYSSKEEIYIRVLTKGFELLNHLAHEAVDGIIDPAIRLRTLAEVYVTFGFENPYYYNIMFNWDVPKYKDYVGTVLEQAAFEEKETAFLFAKTAEQTVAELCGSEELSDELPCRIVKLWSGLHGIVSLSNSHGIDEYIADKDRAVAWVVDRLISEVVNNPQNGSNL